MKGHKLVQSLYNWKDVAKRHERVYETVMEMPKQTMFHTMKKALGVGVIVGICRCYMVVIDFIFGYLLELLWPENDI